MNATITDLSSELPPYTPMTRQRWFNSHRPHELRKALSNPALVEALQFLATESFPSSIPENLPPEQASARLGFAMARTMLLADLHSLTIPPPSAASATTPDRSSVEVSTDPEGWGAVDLFPPSPVT